MSYDPFLRGQYPVGVQTFDVESNNRTVKIEVWYPAGEGYRGQDTNQKTMDSFSVAEGLPKQLQKAVRDAKPADGRFPLVLHCHAAVGHRRDAAPACTHLASHGYLVASPEFAGDTSADLLHDAAVEASSVKRALPMAENLSNREQVVVLTLNGLLSGEIGGIADRIDPENVGAFGVSLGGWTTLRLLSLDWHVKAAFIAAPSWGTHGPFADTKLQHSKVRLDDWHRSVPIFLVAGERDALIPLQDLYELREKLPAPKRFGVLSGASHFHWFENAETAYNICRQMWENGTLAGADVDALTRTSPPFSELCPNAHAIDTLRALCLAHMDDNLKGKNDAKAFLDQNLEATFAARGIGFSVDPQRESIVGA